MPRPIQVLLLKKMSFKFGLQSNSSIPDALHFSFEEGIINGATVRFRCLDRDIHSFVELEPLDVDALAVVLHLREVLLELGLISTSNWDESNEVLTQLPGCVLPPQWPPHRRRLLLQRIVQALLRALYALLLPLLSQPPASLIPNVVHAK